MKQSIQLRLGQNLTMTPQLQQAIKLLQLSTLDLQQEIQSVLESNLMLETADEEAEPGSEKDDNETTVNEAAEAEPELRIEATPETPIPEELPVDSGWEDVYDGSTSFSQSATDERQDNWEGNRSGAETLKEHLEWQMQLARFSPRDEAIALAIIDSINEDGYLTASLEDIHEGLGNELEDLESDEVEAVLHRIQSFDPAGIGARDLSECLLLQLQQMPPDTPLLEQTRAIVREHLAALGCREFNAIKRKLKLDDDALTQAILTIRSLNPRPGSAITGATSEYVIPDVIVTRDKHGWKVELNPDTVPKLRINSTYANYIRRADNSKENTYLKEQLQEARWFIKSLQSRNETLLKVATCIVERQRGFFEYGEEAMKPLVLRDIAEAVEMHESTISRVTTQKYMHTPRGVFEFKYFFSSHVGTTDGGECSATAIRAIIRKQIEAEDPAKPLSDSKIAEILMKQGIKVARRTVAKYREAMSIPPSNERKRLA